MRIVGGKGGYGDKDGHRQMAGDATRRRAGRVAGDAPSPQARRAAGVVRTTWRPKAALETVKKIGDESFCVSFGYGL